MLKTTQPATTPHNSIENSSAPAFFIDPEGIAMIWRRDMVRLWRQRSRMLGAMARALVWLFALGFGLRGLLGSIAGFSYEPFVFPGVIAMTVIFSGLQSAISIVYDREFGFLTPHLRRQCHPRRTPGICNLQRSPEPGNTGSLYHSHALVSYSDVAQRDLGFNAFPLAFTVSFRVG
jgi:hypothetical protein